MSGKALFWESWLVNLIVASVALEMSPLFFVLIHPLVWLGSKICDIIPKESREGRSGPQIEACHRDRPEENNVRA